MGEREYSLEEKSLLEFISGTPALMSLLYDTNLLPEQTHSTRDFGRTMLIAAYWRKECLTRADERAKVLAELREDGVGKIAYLFHALDGVNAEKAVVMSREVLTALLGDQKGETHENNPA